MDKKKGVVIGAGCAGLAAAAFLAKAGHEVTVYEQHTAPGGYWASFQRGGFIFDIGPHWTIMPDRINQKLTELGVEPVQFERMDTIGHYTLLEEDFDLVLERDRRAIEDSIMKKYPTARIGSVQELIDESLRLVAELDKAPTVSPELMSPFDKAGFILKALVSMRRILKYSRMKATEHLERLFPGPELQGLRNALLMVAPAEGMPALGVMVFLAFAIRGDAYRPVGGTQKVTDALTKAVEVNGGRIEYGQRVESIRTEGGRATGIKLTDGSTITSSYVVSGVDAHQMYDRMLDRTLLPAKFKEKIEGFPISQTYFIVSLVTDLDPFRSGLREADHFISPKKGMESALLLNDPENCFFHVGFPHYHTEKVKPGTYGMQILSPVSFDHNSTWATGAELERGEAYKRYKKEYADRILAQVERVVPGLREHIISLDLATPVTMHRYTLNHKGAANGWSYSKVENWKKEIPFVKGLYHVGHWTGPSGIHGCIGSGSTAAQLILRRYKA